MKALTSYWEEASNLMPCEKKASRSRAWRRMPMGLDRVVKKYVPGEVTFEQSFS